MRWATADMFRNFKKTVMNYHELKKVTKNNNYSLPWLRRK